MKQHDEVPRRGASLHRSSVIGRAVAVFSIACLAWCAEKELAAGTIFLGPTPYLSAADSPFDLSGLGETFFLEDFEDGELNTPGIYQPVGRPAQGRVRIPSPTTDSVDADDGVLDGNGTAGHSMRGNTYTVIFTDPKQTFWYLFFAFDASRLGFLPNAFGFVWTDGPPESTVILSAYDVNDVELGVGLFRDLGDDVNDGRTSEDRLFGIRSSVPIHRIRLSSSNRGETRPPEIDHVQYGLQVPEPSTRVMWFLAGLASGVFILTRYLCAPARA